jgi:hypothetical protein
MMICTGVGRMEFERSGEIFYGLLVASEAMFCISTVPHVHWMIGSQPNCFIVVLQCFFVLMNQSTKIT